MTKAICAFSVFVLLLTLLIEANTGNGTMSSGMKIITGIYLAVALCIALYYAFQEAFKPSGEPTDENV